MPKDITPIILDLIQHCGGAEGALEAINSSPTPNKLRKAKKHIRKCVRTYAYTTSNKEENYVFD